jgi:hypothetical protein
LGDAVPIDAIAEIEWALTEPEARILPNSLLTVESVGRLQ